MVHSLNKNNNLTNSCDSLVDFKNIYQKRVSKEIEKCIDMILSYYFDLVYNG